ncbi:MAG: Xaa-Pro peptidase family protein [Dehalococcoidia bacterium]|nr:Xaa-Pro peptidase family protein [Dehalococcoidia bacterium]
MNQRIDIAPAEYRSRLANLRSRMAGQNIDVALVFDHPDVYYFAGTAAYSTLLIPNAGDPTLFVRMGIDVALRDSWLPPDNIRRFQGMEKLIIALAEIAPGARTIGVEKDLISANLWDKLLCLLPHCKIEDISPAILSARMVKSDAEIKLLKRASAISRQGFERCREMLKEGITEMEIQCEIERVQRAIGAEEAMSVRMLAGSGCFGLVASGPNTDQICGGAVAISSVGTSPAHPYGSSLRSLKQGDLVIVNKGTVYQGYHADEARTFVLGKADAKQQEMFKITREIQTETIEAVKPGAAVSEIYDAAKRIALKYDCFDYFMGYGQCGVEYVGHGVGLEIDEQPLIAPRNKTVLQPGMTLAIEPKLVVPGWGGIDIEDTVLVTKSGYERLTHSLKAL